MYGRFDFAYDGKLPPKLIEYNADTPAALLEASVLQWYWLQDRFPHHDQFNSIHEKLIARWQQLGLHACYFSAHSEADEDIIMVEYLRDQPLKQALQLLILI